MIEDEIIITVIVPVYNVADYLERCIKSIQEQTFHSIEIILVDDGSTDDSGKICDEYAAEDNRIRVIHKQNGGLSDARNVGLDIASGQWVTFIDSDDYIEKSMLYTLYTAILENNCQIAISNMIRVFEDGETEIFYKPTNSQVVLTDKERFQTLQQPSVCNKLFKLDLFNEVRFPKGKFYEDTFVYHILVHRADSVVLTGHDGYYYLSRRGSILGRPQYTDRYFDFVEAVYKRCTYLIDNKIDRFDIDACLSLYVAVSNAEKYIVKTTDNQDKFAKINEWYDLAYRYLVKCKSIGIKQKVRLFLLKHIPMVHNKLY